MKRQNKNKTKAQSKNKMDEIKVVIKLNIQLGTDAEEISTKDLVCQLISVISLSWVPKFYIFFPNRGPKFLKTLILAV